MDGETLWTGFKYCVCVVSVCVHVCVGGVWEVGEAIDSDFHDGIRTLF